MRDANCHDGLNNSPLAMKNVFSPISFSLMGMEGRATTARKIDPSR
jgi:hypothetical protein